MRRLLNTGLRFSSLFRDPSRGPAARAADHHYPMAPKVDSLRRRHFTEKMTSGSEDIWAALKRKEDETHKCVAMANGQLKTATSDEERAQIRGKLQEDLRKRTLPLFDSVGFSRCSPVSFALLLLCASRLFSHRRSVARAPSTTAVEGAYWLCNFSVILLRERGTFIQSFSNKRFSSTS